jgi:GTP-binding protein
VLLLLLQDLAGAHWLLQRNLPVTLVFTKVDKAKQRTAAPAANISAFRAALQEAGLSMPPHFATSAVKKRGAQQLLHYLAQRRAQAAQQQQQQLQLQHAAAVQMDTQS